MEMEKKLNHFFINKIKPKLNELNEEQNKVFNRILAGENLFITGDGGTGKSYLIKYIYNYYKKNKLKNVQVVSLTGISAYLLNCNAVTLHSWAGIGLGVNINVDNIPKKKIKQWCKTDLLIIDEISMLTGDLFDKLNNIAKKIRNSNKPFGGIQLLLSGDFYQLPPVKSNSLCFESLTWFECFNGSYELDGKKIKVKSFGNVCVLQEIQRQKHDKLFIDILNNLRKGIIKPEHLEIIKKHKQKPTNPEESDEQEHEKNTNKNPLYTPIQIFVKNRNVNNINNNALKKLNEPIMTFRPTIQIININTNKIIYDTENKNLQDPKKIYFNKIIEDIMHSLELKLCLGACVMCTKNINQFEGIVNGIRGYIISITQDIITVKFENGFVKDIERLHETSLYNEHQIIVNQFPLKLAWAITIHKSQGATLNSAIIDCGSDIFEYGQIYVALSRLKSLDGLELINFDETKIKVNPKVKYFYKKIS